MDVYEAIRDEALVRARIHIFRNEPTDWGWAAKYAKLADIYGRLALGCETPEAITQVPTSGTAHLPHPEWMDVPLSQAIKARMAHSRIAAVFGSSGGADPLDDCILPR